MWWAVLLVIVQYIVSIGGQILQVPFAMRVVLMYVIGVVMAALWLLARYRARGPLRLRADQLRSTGAVVIPVLLDPVTAPVGLLLMSAEEVWPSLSPHRSGSRSGSRMSRRFSPQRGRKSPTCDSATLRVGHRTSRSTLIGTLLIRNGGWCPLTHSA